MVDGTTRLVFVVLRRKAEADAPSMIHIRKPTLGRRMMVDMANNFYLLRQDTVQKTGDMSLLTVASDR
jgi:hypothetical protein